MCVTILTRSCPKKRKEGWLALAALGGRFTERAASELTRWLPHDPRVSHDIRYYLVYSALCRGDLEKARMFVNDWAHATGRPAVTVYKWIPGYHYHADGRRFDTLDDARRWIESRGMVFGGLEERHVYATEGD